MTDQKTNRVLGASRLSVKLGKRLALLRVRWNDGLCVTFNGEQK